MRKCTLYLEALYFTIGFTATIMLVSSCAQATPNETCWCCINGKVGIMSPQNCKKRGGQCRDTKKEAEKECSRTIRGTRCNNPPEAQVVNNCGHPLDKVKIGRVQFSRNLSRCSDGCSTGFRPVNSGRNSVAIMARRGTGWKKIGAVKMFKNCKHYAVNIEIKGDSICAQLALLRNTEVPYNRNPAKSIIDTTCSSLTRRINSSSKRSGYRAPKEPLPRNRPTRSSGSDQPTIVQDRWHKLQKAKIEAMLNHLRNDKEQARAFLKNPGALVSKYELEFNTEQTEIVQSVVRGMVRGKKIKLDINEFLNMGPKTGLINRDWP